MYDYALIRKKYSYHRIAAYYVNCTCFCSLHSNHRFDRIECTCLHRPTYSVHSYIDYIYSVRTYLDPLKLMHLCNIPNVYIILQKNKKYTVSTLLTALKNFVTDLVPSEIVCFDNSGKRVGCHTHILIIFDDMHVKEPICITSQSHVKLFWLVDCFFATQLDTSYPHHTQVTLFLHHHVMCHVSKLTNLLLLPPLLQSNRLLWFSMPFPPACFLSL